jgi:hypothetical protein
MSEPSLMTLTFHAYAPLLRTSSLPPGPTLPHGTLLTETASQAQVIAVEKQQQQAMAPQQRKGGGGGGGKQAAGWQDTSDYSFTPQQDGSDGAIGEK